MRKFLPLLILMLSLGAYAQTTTTYQSFSGTVSSTNAVTGHLERGGSFVSPDSMGNGCHYGACPDWQFSNYAFSYVLGDGTTAHLTNFSGSADFTTKSEVRIVGTASGYDSTGGPVFIRVAWAWGALCRTGGSCTKHCIAGDLTINR